MYLVPWMLKSPLTSDPKNISSNTYNTYLTRTRFHLFENQSKYTYQVGFRFVIKLSCGLNRNRNFALVVNYLSCHHQVIHIVVHAAPCSTVMQKIFHCSLRGQRLMRLERKKSLRHCALGTKGGSKHERCYSQHNNGRKDMVQVCGGKTILDVINTGAI